MFDKWIGLPRTLIETPRSQVFGSTVHVRPEREALPAKTGSTCCSGSRATIRTGIGGWRLSSFVTQVPYLPAPPGDDAPLRALRRELRARRRAVPPADRRHAAQRLAWQVERSGWLKAGSRLGLYLAMPEEIDTAPLVARALARHCQVFVPRVTDYRRHRMHFLPLGQKQDQKLHRGRYGILEPDAGPAISARKLDVLLMPLVGFDARGNRIGMGKGYYDRALAFRIQRRSSARPLLIGLAFECQRVDALPVRPHDVALDRLVTEARVRRFTLRHTPRLVTP